MKRIKRFLGISFELVAIVLGCFLSAVAINTLIIPSQLITGGIAGISIVVNHFTGWSVATQYLAYNVPILVWSYVTLGKKFSLYSVIGVVVQTAWMHYIPVESLWTKDTLLNAVFGGIIGGIGSAIILRIGGSSGGLDMIARIIIQYKYIPIGKFSLVFNSIIVIVSGFMFTAQSAMYTLISFFTNAKTYDVLLNHTDRITMMIITEKGREVSQAIIQNIRRGVTTWDASGAYTKENKQVLYCVVVNIQKSELQRIVLSVDGKAFITVQPVQQVIGNFKFDW